MSYASGFITTVSVRNYIIDKSMTPAPHLQILDFMPNEMFASQWFFSIY